MPVVFPDVFLETMSAVLNTGLVSNYLEYDYVP
jgi:hypothetical protein